MFKSLKRSIRAFLLTLQRYTKTDMVYLTRNGFWVLTSYAIQVGTGVVTTIALANLLPKEAFGTYQFVLAVAGILSVMTLSGLQKAVIRAVAQGNDGVLRSGVQTKLKWNIGIVLASGAVAVYYFFNGENDLGIAFLIVGAFVPLIEGFKLYHAFLIGKEAFRDTVTLGAWRKPLPLIALLLTVYFSDSLLLLVFVYFASNALAYIALYHVVVRKYQPPHTADAEMVGYSKHLSVLKVAGKIANNLDKILLWHFLGAAAVASFAIAQLATRYSGGVLETLMSQVLPKVSRRDLPTLQKTLPHKIRLFTLLMAASALAYILIAPFIFPLLFPEYPESVLLSQALAIGLIFVPRSVYGQVFTAHKLIRSQYIVGMAAPITRLFLLWLLLSLYGLWGAVYAILGTQLIISIAMWYFFTTAKAPSEPQ